MIYGFHGHSFFLEVEWKYNSEENNYQRYLAGVEQKGITAKNIIIQMLSNQLIQDDEKGRLNMPVVGKGAIFYYLDGEEKQGTWEKDDYENKTIFLNEEQKEIRLNKGVTWIEVVDYAWKIEFQNQTPLVSNINPLKSNISVILIDEITPHRINDEDYLLFKFDFNLIGDFDINVNSHSVTYSF